MHSKAIKYKEKLEGIINIYEKLQTIFKSLKYQS